MKKYSHETIVGVFVVLGLIGIYVMAVKLGNVDLVGDDTNTFYAPFSTVSGLRVGNSVEMLGMEIGRVADFRMDQEKLQAIVTLEVDKEIEIFDDAIVSIKTAGLIGDKFINLDPGGGGDPLADGDTIIETESPIDLNDLISKYAFGDVDK
ncbi:MAG: outer membrane lipid asymmetry maintenance protein MlaD [Desulfobacterales bacterium]|nr:outer membrane lipid asymmetry maintenance protein MlaD [Desulfobacterales bacterium]MDJ0804745.1 outer membrane lipid asymmetry maintenance protein MlaD [Desulfobacterales bacterium]